MSFLLFSDDSFSKKQKSEDDSIELKCTPKIEIKKDSHLEPLDRSAESGDLADSDLSQCLNKSGSSGSSHLSTKSPPLSSQGSSNQCNYNSLSGSVLSKPYGSSCMTGGLGGADPPSYYPHHSPVDRSSSSFLPVTSTPPLLPPQGAGAVSSSLALHTLSSMNQMSACRLPVSSLANTDCAMRGQQSHLSAAPSYGLRGASPPPQHPSLPSCTYMQTTQGSAYPTHLTQNVHMMNMNFPGPMA